MLRLERHPFGPRVYLLHRRIHEYHLGLAILVALAAGSFLDDVDLGLTTVLAALAGVWRVAKDWRDLGSSKRDSAMWQLGLHRRAAPLRGLRRYDSLPLLAALWALAAGIVNLVSAATPNSGWRHRVLLRVESLDEIRIFHALALPASAGLIVTAFYLYRRRRGALHVAVGPLPAAAGRRAAGARRSARVRVPDLQAARRAAQPSRRRGSAGGEAARPPARHGHPRVLQAPPGQAVPVRSGPKRLSRLPDRERRPALLGRSGRAACCPAGARLRGGCVRRAPRAEARRVRRQRRVGPALAPGGPARALHRRRGGGRGRLLLARRPRDPQGAPVRGPVGEVRLLGGTGRTVGPRRAHALRARGSCGALARRGGRTRRVDGDGLAPHRTGSRRRRTAGA